MNRFYFRTIFLLTLLSIILVPYTHVVAAEHYKCVADCVISLGSPQEEQLAQYGIKIIKARYRSYYRPPPRRPTYNRSYSSKRNTYRRPPVAKIKPLSARPLRAPTARLAPKRLVKPLRRTSKPTSLKRRPSKLSSLRVKRLKGRLSGKSLSRKVGLRGRKLFNRQLKKTTGKSLNKSLRKNAKKLFRPRHKKAGIFKRGNIPKRFGKAKRAGVRGATRFSKWKRNAGQHIKLPSRRSRIATNFSKKARKFGAGLNSGKKRTAKENKRRSPVRILATGSRSLFVKGGRILRGASGKKPVLKLKTNSRVAFAQKQFNKKVKKNIYNVANDNKRWRLANDNFIKIKGKPGPRLSLKNTQTFRGNAYKNRKLKANETFYKYHGINNRTGKKVSWVTNKKYKSESSLRKDLAIKKSWGVTNKVSKFKVPKGTWVSEGKAASQGKGYSGGGYQAVITNIPKSWIKNTNKAF